MNENVTLYPGPDNEKDAIELLYAIAMETTLDLSRFVDAKAFLNILGQYEAKHNSNAKSVDPLWLKVSLLKIALQANL